MNTRAESNVSSAVRLLNWLWHGIMGVLGIRATIPVSVLVLMVCIMAWALWSPRDILELWKFLMYHGSEQLRYASIPLPTIN
jgi:hypothetical protein